MVALALDSVPGLWDQLLSSDPVLTPPSLPPVQMRPGGDPRLLSAHCVRQRRRGRQLLASRGIPRGCLPSSTLQERS